MKAEKKKIPFGGLLLIYITVMLTLIFAALAFMWRAPGCFGWTVFSICSTPSGPSLEKTIKPVARPRCRKRKGPVYEDFKSGPGG